MAATGVPGTDASREVPEEEPLGKFVALLRGINVGGRTSLKMAELRTLAEEIGWRDVATYVQSGNLVFEAEGKTADLEAELERAIQRRFGMTVAVLVRSAGEWKGYLDANPLPEASESDPGRVLVSIAKEPPAADAAEKLQARAQDGEQVRLAAGALWIYFPQGSGRSKLFSGLSEGAPATTRNWRTMVKIGEMLSG
jgi:uncharacterized protein (DUF1697 family)